jgi:hypothetical protein
MNQETDSRTQNPLKRRSGNQGMFKELDAVELYCPRCKRAVPLRKRLLLVLPEGDKYEYRCAFCFETVGTKTDRKEKAVSLII